jgi:diguanylate cyclase (GGDEF)-like protein
LRLEWRLILARWAAIGVFAIALALHQMPVAQTTAAYIVLAAGFGYTCLLLRLVRRRVTVVLDGSLPTIGDGMLCVAMFAALGGFETPFYSVLYAVAISAGMRLGLRRGVLMSAGIASVEGLGTLGAGHQVDGGFVVRSGMLFVTVLLTSYLYEESQKTEAALADRLHQSQVLNSALEHQAQHDLLTDLPNRHLLHVRLHDAIALCEADGGGSLALLVIDLDRFKEVNDTFGHQFGDLLLQQIGPRLRDALGPHDTIARLGGDEFAVLLTDADAKRAERVARCLLAALDESFAICEYSLDLAGSIGIALYPEHGADFDVLLRRADVAMYVAKRGGRGYEMYAPDQDQHSPQRLALVGELRRAIDNDGLELFYQPKLGLRSGRLVGVEALVRWPHPQRDLIPPDQFIPLAEQTGLIKSLSRWVIDTALRQAREWQELGIVIPIAVNLSMRDLHDPELPETVAHLLRSWNVPPSRLAVEITENGLMAEPARALQTVSALRGMGIRIAIDDFGTGYSSLAYLKRLPVDELKIDRSFVRDMAEDRDDLAIVRSTISLGHDLGLSIVAEGIEDAATWELLQQLGCDVAQGFYLGRPVRAHDLVERFRPGLAAAA